MLKVKSLSKSYWQSDRKIPVLQALDLELKRGETLAIVGASGVGKSSLLHCIGLLDEFEAGSLQIDGQEIKSVRSVESHRIRQEKIGFVFQFHYLMAELSALENVMVPLLIEGKTKEEARRQAEIWLTKVGLLNRLHHKPSQLSGGEQQRVSMARALVRRPALILADEPTGNLDPQTASEVFDVLLERAKELNAGFIMATHNLELAERLQRKLTLRQGRLD